MQAVEDWLNEQRQAGPYQALPPELLEELAPAPVQLAQAVVPILSE